MKQFFRTFLKVLEGFGRARAAAEFARMGRHDLAKKTMLRD